MEGGRARAATTADGGPPPCLGRTATFSRRGRARGESVEDRMAHAGHAMLDAMKAAGSRLARPKLVASFMHWQKDWEAVEAANASMSMQQRLDAEAAKCSAVEQELAKVRNELNEARKAMAAGLGQEAEKARQLAEQLEAERVARVEHLGKMGVKRLMQMGLARGWTACSSRSRPRAYLVADFRN